MISGITIQDADRILVLDRGHLVNVGSHDELMESSEIYRSTYLAQQKGGNDNESENA